VSAKRAGVAVVALGLALGGLGARAGPYTEPGYAPGVVETWAAGAQSIVSTTRGPIDIANPGGPTASFGAPEYVLGPATADVYDVVSLGDGGQITLYFAAGIPNRPGDDFAVFENGFYAPGGLFGELAFVEVSSNGTDFARFPATCLNPSRVPDGGVIDPTDYHNLAGKHPIDRGTGFDLGELAGHPLVAAGKLDLTRVAWVRLVDVIGNGSTTDAAGRPVYDPYPTAYASGGFDANAVGVPEPGPAAALAAGALGVAALARRRHVCARSH
jgi:uncharacterized protein (TIGR03382 family)